MSHNANGSEQIVANSRYIIYKNKWDYEFCLYIPQFEEYRTIGYLEWATTNDINNPLLYKWHPYATENNPVSLGKNSLEQFEGETLKDWLTRILRYLHDTMYIRILTESDYDWDNPD